jgi:8-oxo-dGTP pyrophosphatase MutT (NUDIX family)
MVKRYNKVLVDIITPNDERLFVQDSKTKEWGVVTGGCKGTFQNFELVGERYTEFMEKVLQNAIRELKEEINISFDKHRYIFTKKQYTFYTPNEFVEKTNLYINKKQFIYYIYTIYITEKEQKDIFKKFIKNEEIIDIKFVQKNSNIENKWELLNHLNIQ